MRKNLCKVVAMALFAMPALAENQAYTWENTLTLESLSDIHGGIAKGTRNLGNLDVTLTVDTQAAEWWQSGTLFVYVLGDYGSHPSELTGELQTLSNIEAENALKIYEFWYEHSFAGGAAKLLIGLHDHNSTFDSLDSAGLFSLSAFGIGPEIAQGGAFNLSNNGNNRFTFFGT